MYADFDNCLCGSLGTLVNENKVQLRETMNIAMQDDAGPSWELEGLALKATAIPSSINLSTLKNCHAAQRARR